MFSREQIKELRDIFLETYFSYDKYRGGEIGYTIVKFSRNFYAQIEDSIREANLSKDYFSAVCIRRYLDKFIAYLEDKPLEAIVVTLKDKKDNPYIKQKVSPLQIEEMRGLPNYMRLKCGEYRIICVKSNDFRKLLFFGVFHRRDGYKKAIVEEFKSSPFIQGLFVLKGFDKYLSEPPLFFRQLELNKKYDSFDGMVEILKDFNLKQEGAFPNKWKEVDMFYILNFKE